MYLVTSEQMRCFDHDTIQNHHVPGIVLMDHAGREIAKIVAAHHPKRVVVFCGKGNNGGDGWLCARWLHHAGVQVHVETVVDPATSLDGDAFRAFQMAHALGLSWQVYQPGNLKETEADILVDALLGTGCTRSPQGQLAQIIEDMNASRIPIIAADVPTGVNASTGEVYQTAIQASETVAIAYEKLGTAITPGAMFAGRVHVVDIGITAPLPEGLAAFTHPEMFHAAGFKPRDRMSHKGTYGRCGIYVGQMQGAAILAAAGAARVGTGLVVLVSQAPIVNPVPPDYVVRALNDEDLETSFADCTAIVVGPGMGGTAADFDEQWLPTLLSSGKTGVIDADGLRGLGANGELTEMGPNWVLTPHPKECAQLLGWSTEQVQSQRLLAAQTLAEATGSTVLLKGYRTLIVSSEGAIRINPTGDASLAVGGSGDVLAGIIGGLIGQGVSPFDAASIGAWIHGCAGELAGAALTPVSTTASDIIAYISRAIMSCFDNLLPKT